MGIELKYIVALGFFVCFVWIAILSYALSKKTLTCMSMNTDMLCMGKEMMEQQKQLGIHAELLTKQEEAIQRLENKPVDAISKHNLN